FEQALAGLEPERVDLLIELNARAGRRALATGGPSSARGYLLIASELLATRGPFPATDHPLRELAIDLELDLSQADSLTGQHALAEARQLELLGRELDVREFGKLAVSRLRSLIVASKIHEAHRFSVETLARLGVDLPLVPRRRHLVAAAWRARRLVQPASLARLRSLPPASDPRVHAACEVMRTIVSVIYAYSVGSYLLLVERHASLLARHGYHPSLPATLTQLARAIANALGMRDQARE